MTRATSRLSRNRPVEQTAGIQMIKSRDETAPPTAKPMEQGVYFGLPAAAYHADLSLGSTDIKRLLQAPPVYWFHSWMNPSRPPSPDSAAKQRGRALHKRVLEGEEAFARAFAEAPSPEDYPGSLASHEDLKAKCRELCEPVSGAKAELAKRIKAKAPEVIIFDEIVAAFRAMAERDGVEILSADAMREVKQAADTITLNRYLARAFEGGVAEASVFWVEDDVPLKARFDYLKPRTIVDLKRFSNQRERPVDVAIRLAIAEYRYDVQARHYCDAYAALYGLAGSGRVFGECGLPVGWPKLIVPPADLRWTWIFHQTDGAPVSKGRDLSPLSPVLNKATREIALAKSAYRQCVDQFGTDPWIDCEPVREFAEGELPGWLREEPEVL
jgi:hypothetical protein